MYLVRMGKAEDLTGRRFGRLTVLARVHQPGNPTWLCICDCGSEKKMQGSGLRNGAVKSCGCLKLEILKNRATTHGQCVGGRCSRPYRIWASMKQRCRDQNAVNYSRYGGRGIHVCERWRVSFQSFIADMGLPPSDTHSIDRIDNDGNYQPGNCRWANAMEQRANRRDTRLPKSPQAQE